jgi:hypothetical protein
MPIMDDLALSGHAFYVGEHNVGGVWRLGQASVNVAETWR